MKKKRIIGGILKIPICGEYHTYARILREASYAFYDCKSDKDIEDINVIINKPILFVIAVYDDAISRWEFISEKPLEDQLQRLPPKFIQNAFDKTNFSIYEDGNIREAEKGECVGLERAVVWSPERVEERLRDYYAGRPNQWIELYKIKS